MNELIKNWEFIAAIGGGLWAAWSFLATRKRELSWKRTEFIIHQSEFLDSDAEMRDCTLMVYGKHPTLKVSDFLNASSSDAPTDEKQAQLIIMFERYLNFLWRIAYAHIALGTLTKVDLHAFGAYYFAVANNESLRAYCLREGYDEIISVAQILSGSANKSM